MTGRPRDAGYRSETSGKLQASIGFIRNPNRDDALAKIDGAPLYSLRTLTDRRSSISLHQVLEGLVGWKSKWELIQPEANSLVRCKMPSASAPPGHIVYGKSRSRAVWFPANFRSVADYPEALFCYHQNLSMATLHTEALCVLAQDAASRLAVQASLADFSVTYRNCARLAAGLLGRLHGRKSDESVGTKPSTYRSGSVRTQILLHKDVIDQLRLALLAGGTPLDA